MVKVIYTGKATKEEITQELNKQLSSFIDALNDKEETGFDDY